jgi:hypothetical protein
MRYLLNLLLNNDITKKGKKNQRGNLRTLYKPRKQLNNKKTQSTKYIKYKQTRARRTLDQMRVNPGTTEDSAIPACCNTRRVGRGQSGGSHVR